MIPPYKPGPIWDRIEQHVSKERVYNDQPNEKTILVCKLGWDEEAGEPKVIHAFRRQFLTFLETKDIDGLVRKAVAEDLAQLAEHMRTGDIFRD